MSNYIAQSTVLVRADTTPFRAQLERAVKQADNKKVVVQVVPTTVGFVRALNEELRNLKGVRAVPVPVVPVLAPGFRNTVRAAVVQAVEGLNVPVGVVPGAAAVTRAAPRAAAAGVSTGGVVDKRVAAAQLAIASATDAGVSARRRFDKALSDSEKQVLRDARVGLQLKTSTEAIAAAAKAGVPALQAEAEALHLTALAANEANEARKARAIARDPATIRAATEAAAAAERKAAEDAIKRDETRAASAAAAERSMVKQHISAIKENEARDAEAAAKFTALQEEKIASIEAEMAALNQRARATQISPGISGRTRTRDILGQTIAGGGAAIDDRAIKRNLAFEDSVAAAQRAETDFANARRQTARAAIFADDIEKKVAATRAAERAAIDDVVERQLAYNAAVEAGVPSLVATRAEELRLAKARLVDAQSATTAAEAQLARSGQIGAARRAFEAFGATLAGLRGAALSAQGAFLAAGASAILITKAVKSSAELTSTLNVFKVTAGASADQMVRVSETARQLGADMTLPGVTAQDAAQALTELSKAGLSVQDSIDGARGVLQLATAAGIDNAQATELAASALNAFGLAGDQAVRVADVLANAANDSQGSISDMGVALQQAAAVSRQAGLTLEQTVSVLTLFARAGLRGSDAGTSFRTALIRLINPTTKAQKEIDKLGLHLRTATGAINLNVFSEFEQKTRDLTAAQRDQALAVIFGQDAIRGAAILARTGAAGLDAQTLSLEKQGTAAELAAARMSGLTGAIANLQNQMSTLGIAVGQVVSIGLTPFVNGVANAIGAVNSLAQEIVNLGNKASALPGILEKAKEDLDALFGEKPKAGINIGPVHIDDKDARTIIKKFFSFAGKEATSFWKNFLSIPVAPLKPLFDAITPDPKTVSQARNQVQGLVQDFNKVGGLTQLNESVKRLKALSAEMRQGDDQSKAFAKDLDEFIKRIQTLSANPKIDPFELQITIPPKLLSGEPGRLLGEANKKAFLKAVFVPPTDLERAFGVTGLEGLFNKFPAPTLADPRAAFDKWKNSFKDAADAAAKEARAARARLQKAITGAEGKVSGLERAKIDLEISGASDAALLRNANQRLAAQQAVVAKEEQRRNKILEDTGKQSNERLRAAKEKLAQIQSERKAILEGMASDAEKAKQDAQDARDKADQALLDSFLPAERKVETQQALAQSDEALQNDIAGLRARKRLLLHEIRVIKDDFKDRKKAQDLIHSKRIEIIGIDQQIAADFKSILESSPATEKFEAKLSLAEAIGNIPLQIRLINQRIKFIDKLIASHKAEGVALIKLKTEREQRRSQINDLRDQQLSERTALAQSIFDLTGNKSPLLKALAAEIANKKREIAAAKRAGRSTVVLRTELNGLLKQRKEILNQLKKDQQGTTAFDLMKQGLETFNASAGNLVFAGQPFASAAGFNADIAQFLKFRKQPPPNLTPGAGGKTKLELNDDRLVRSLDRLTDAVERQGGNGSTATTAPLVGSWRGTSEWGGWFNNSRTSRWAQES